MTMERKTISNKGFAIAGVPSFSDTFVQGSTLGIRLNFCVKNPLDRQVENR